MPSTSSDCGVYVMMVMPCSNFLPFKNLMCKHSSILKNYRGELTCVAEEVKVVEGQWPHRRTVALLYFSSDWDAKQFLRGDDAVKQPDFMDGINIVIIPLKEIPPRGKPFFVLANVRVYDHDRFLHEYSPKTDEVRQDGKVAVTAACPEPTNHRGNWTPNMLIINQWDSEADYIKFINSAEYRELKELRQQISRSDVICFQSSR